MLEEMENIKYGNLETAMEYCKRNRTEEWIQQFLRCDGHSRWIVNRRAILYRNSSV